MSEQLPDVRLRQALTVELILARGFPLSVTELVYSLARSPLVRSHRSGRVGWVDDGDHTWRVGAAMVENALEELEHLDAVSRVYWPGPASSTTYWVSAGTNRSS